MIGGMRRTLHWALHRPATVLAAFGTCTALGCGYGFGNGRFGAMKRTARAFAVALESKDTLRLRELSRGDLQRDIVAMLRDLPPAYAQFARPTPEVITAQGGGLYASPVSATFLVRSTLLKTCSGGVELYVLVLNAQPRVQSIRLVPALDSIDDETCRVAIADPSSR
jgi:hypothetical protein